MAKAGRCDRCGEYFDWSSDRTHGFAYLLLGFDGQYHIDGGEYDLCPICVWSLERWVESGMSSEKIKTETVKYEQSLRGEIE